MLTRTCVLALALLASCVGSPAGDLSGEPAEPVEVAALAAQAGGGADCCLWQDPLRIYVVNDGSGDVSVAWLEIQTHPIYYGEAVTWRYRSYLYTYYPDLGTVLHSPDPAKSAPMCEIWKNTGSCYRSNVDVCFYEWSINPFNHRTTRTLWCDMADVITGDGPGHVQCLSDWCLGQTWTVYTDELSPPG